MMQLNQPKRKYKLFDVLMSMSIFGVFCFVLFLHQGLKGFFHLTLLSWQFILIAILCGTANGVKGTWVSDPSLISFLLGLGTWLNAGFCYFNLYSKFGIDEIWFAGFLRSLPLVVEMIVGISLKHNNPAQ